MSDSVSAVTSVLEWLGVPGNEARLGNLTRYHHFLGTEAIQAGALGPGEKNRLWTRHIADSLTFAAAFESTSTVLDVGSGAGLPGIPLALLYSDVEFILLDRSERRCVLTRRVTRVLGLDNVAVVCGDIAGFQGEVDTIVSRAALPIDELVKAVTLLAPPARLLVAAASHGKVPPRPVLGAEILEVPAAVLRGPVWLWKVPLPVEFHG